MREISVRRAWCRCGTTKEFAGQVCAMKPSYEQRMACYNRQIKNLGIMSQCNMDKVVAGVVAAVVNLVLAVVYLYAMFFNPALHASREFYSAWWLVFLINLAVFSTAWGMDRFGNYPKGLVRS